MAPFYSAGQRLELMAMEPERARSYSFIGGAGQPVIAQAQGPWLITPEGRRIYDAAGGAIVANIGHGRAEVAEVARQALGEASYVVPPFATEHRLRLVERLRAHWLPGGIRRVMLTSGGSESVDAAMRLARQHHVSSGNPGRSVFLARALSYHGVTLTTLGVGGHSKRQQGFEPYLSPEPRVPACYPLRCALCSGRSACTLACAEALGEAIERIGASKVAAFIAEPIGGSTAGALVPPDGYWPRVAEICREHGVLLIADEVMTGFGRTGKRFAVDHWDVVPDILVGGKGLTGGYAPMGGVYATEHVVAPIAEQRDDFMFFTYGAHPMGCAVADKVLEILDREGLVERAAEMGERLSERLAPLRDHPNVGEVRGRGLLQAVEFVRDKKTRTPFAKEVRFSTRVAAAGLANGVFFYPGGCPPAQDVVCFGPPFIITPEEIDFVVGVLEKSLGEALAGID